MTFNLIFKLYDSRFTVERDFFSFFFFYSLIIQRKRTEMYPHEGGTWRFMKRRGTTLKLFLSLIFGTIDLVDSSKRNNYDYLRTKFDSSNGDMEWKKSKANKRNLLYLFKTNGYRNAIYANRSNVPTDDYSFQQAFDISSRQILFPITVNDGVSFLYAFITVAVLPYRFTSLQRPHDFKKRARKNK